MTMDGIQETLFKEEVKTTANAVIDADKLGWLITDPVYAQWQKALDDAFVILSDFAKAHNIEI